MIIASRTQFHVERPWGQCLFSSLALVGAFSVLTNLRMELFQALPLTQGLPEVHHRDGAGGAAAGQGPAVAADQGEHPGGPGHHQQH